MKASVRCSAFFVLGLCLSPSLLPADEVWVARCHGLLFAYDRTGRRAHLYMEKKGLRFPIAAGPIVSDENETLGALFMRDDWSSDGIASNPGQVGIDRNRRIVTVIRRTRSGQKELRRTFCKAVIRVSERSVNK